MTEATNYIEFIDKYCERVTLGVWDEPLNVISNIAFFAIAVLLFRYFRKNFQSDYGRHWDIAILIGFAFCISIGSTLWHLYAQRWALYTDVIPILLFINLFLLSCFFRVLKLPLVLVFVCFAVYHLMNTFVQSNFSIDVLNGSIFYVPVFLCLLSVTLVLLYQKSTLAKLYAYSTVLFAFSLILRTLDLSQCESFPIGTHFLWHSSIAIMLYWLTKSLMLSAKNDSLGKSPRIN